MRCVIQWSFSKKQGISLSEVTTRARLYNYVRKLGAGEYQIESFVVNLFDGPRSLPQEKIIDQMNHLYEISKSESIPPTEVPAYVKQRTEEK
jgi:hypothetical protein